MYQLSDSLREESSALARLLGAVRSRAAGALGIAAVLAVVALPDPLPAYPAGAYALVGVAEGVGLAVAAENLVWRPAKRFDFGRASRRVGGVVGTAALFVVAMAALGVELGPRDRALLAGFCLSAPSAIAAIDYLKARVQADLLTSDSA
ncbi:hypothetical protein [Halorussus sp. MSC15.2]|uniref:hypothetical protein n=1 Tax=Halorussus sp. MSC15.2 TaxID=2283638 RepID=UPI0013D6F0A5|nr:hypothetical protein [Halorussus sp. MSC15.2]NEU56177.1 hypothetical protein [Halorussus sp. MSC15.2]